MDLSRSSRQHFKKSFIARENGLWRRSISSRTSRLCVFCAAKLKDDDADKDKIDLWSSIRPKPLSKETFVRGISILCDKLNFRGYNVVVDGDGREFANLEEWALAGVGNFVSWVCCTRCYQLLANVVSLEKLIVKTKEAQQIQQTSLPIDKSEKNLKKGELKSSGDACDRYQSEFIHNINKRIVECGETLGFTRLPRSPSLIGTKVTSISDKVDSCKVDHSENSSNNGNACDKLKTYCSDNDKRAPLQVLNSNLDEATVHRPLVKKRKFLGKENLEPKDDESSSEAKGKKVKKSKRLEEKVALTKNNLILNTHSSSAEQLQKSANNDDETSQQKLSSPSSHNNHEPEDTDNINPEALIRFKPMYVLSASQDLFMVSNVKFKKLTNALLCLHPNCQYVEPILGLFSNQLSFHTLRCHVQYEHRRVHTRGVPYGKRFYYCHFCDAQLKTRIISGKHSCTTHPNYKIPPVLCEVCGDIMPKSEIVQHTISHKSMEEKEIGNFQMDITRPYIFPCNECNMTFKSYSAFAQHKTSHIPLDSRRQIICDACDARLSSLRTLKQHKLTVHGKTLSKKLKCKFCDMKFRSFERNKLRIHVSSHIGDNPYKCSACDKGFKYKKNLKQHEDLHLDQCFACEFCSRKFRISRYLRRHHLEHHQGLVAKSDLTKTNKLGNDFIGPKLLYPCEPCKHVFYEKHDLISHLKGRKHNINFENKKDYPTRWTMKDQLRFCNGE